MFLQDAPGSIGDSQLEDGLCKIDGNGSSIHFGLLSFEDLTPTPMKTRAPISAQTSGGVHPIIQPDSLRPGCLVYASRLTPR